MPYQQYQVPPVVSTPSYPHPLQPPAVVTTPYQPHVPTTPSSTRSSYIAPATIPAPVAPPPVAEVVAPTQLPAQLPPAFIPQLAAPLTPPVQEAPQFPAETPEEEASETRIPYWPQVSNSYLTHKTRSDFTSSRGTPDPTYHGQPSQRNKRNERLRPGNQRRWLRKMMSNNPAKVTRRFQTPLTLLKLRCLAPRLHPQHRLPLNTHHRQIPQHHLLPRQRCNRWLALQNPLIATCLLQSCPHSQEFWQNNHQLLPRLSRLRPRCHHQRQNQSQTRLPMDQTARHRKPMLMMPQLSQLQHHQDRNPGPTFSRALPKPHALILAWQVLLQLLQALRSRTTSPWLTPSFLSMPIFTAAKSPSSSREALLIPAICVI